MKKLHSLLSFLFIFVLLFSSLLPGNHISAASTVPSVQAHAYVVMDAHSGKILFSKNETKKIYPASTVKLMTALVALNKYSASKKITITKKMLSQIPSDAAVIGLKAGSSYSVSDLLHMLLMPSAADAATTLAVSSYGSNANFVKQMNKMSKSLGLTKTSFDNPIGLDIGSGYYKTYTTAKDFSKLARYAMANKTIRTIVAKPSYTIPATKNKKKFKIKNTNAFYSTAPYSTQKYTIIGTKTGTTRAAGSVLIATAKDKDGHEVICAFFGNAGQNQLYADIKTLFDYTFTSYENGTISLSKGFYDTRFLASDKIIRRYYNKGIIRSSSDTFSPTKKVTQKTFVDMVNKIADTKLVAPNGAKQIRIKDFAEILYQAYPQTIKTSTKNSIKKELTNTKNMSEKSILKVVLLYNSNILPKNISKNVNAYLTKEDMILIGDSMISFVKNYTPAKTVSNSSITGLVLN